MWEKRYPEEVMNRLLAQLDKRSIPMAAICAATTVLAKAGILKERKHTSNPLSYLEKAVPGYSESANYVNSLAVSDRQVVTASGLEAL